GPLPCANTHCAKMLFASTRNFITYECYRPWHYTKQCGTPLSCTAAFSAKIFSVSVCPFAARNSAKKGCHSEQSE
ncbi:MAG: hypothetical protein J6C04_08155, partial [Oscillospiraceae bacterium]|nr:hypothetical protein [Oscillospiraceae bacterium]